VTFHSKDGESFQQCERFAATPASVACDRWGKICNRLAILLLLVGLAGLSAVAKDGQYHRVSNIEHQSSLATKMNVPPTPVILGSAELKKVARTFATKPPKTFRPRFQPEPPPTESVGVTVAMQHRSPPESLQS
jgi:hypothetical protein